MPIVYNEKTRTFKLDAGDSSYCIGVGPEEYLITHYYGKKIPDTDFSSYAPYAVNMSSFNPMRFSIGNGFSMDCDPLEYPSFGTGDFRRTAIRIRGTKGNMRRFQLYFEEV